MSGAERFATYLKKKDPGLFRKLVEQLSPKVFGLSSKLFSDRADAEDVTQEVFLALFRRSEPFADDASLEMWLCGAAVNLARKKFRSQARRRNREQRYQQEAPTAISPGLDARELTRELGQQVARLPVGLRIPLVLNRLEGRPLRSIAELLGCSVGTVHNRVKAGLTRLRSSLSASGYTPCMVGLLARVEAPSVCGSAFAATAAGATVPATFSLTGLAVAVLLVAGAAAVGLPRVLAPAGEQPHLERAQAQPETRAEPLSAVSPAAWIEPVVAVEPATASAPVPSEPGPDAARPEDADGEPAHERVDERRRVPHFPAYVQQETEVSRLMVETALRRAVDLEAEAKNLAVYYAQAGLDGLEMLVQERAPAAHPLDKGSSTLDLAVESKAAHSLSEVEAFLWAADAGATYDSRPAYRELALGAGLRARFSDLPAGSFCLEVRAARHTPVYVWLELSTDAPLQMRVQLEAQLLITGRLLTEGRLPVVGARIEAGGAEVLSEQGGHFQLSPELQPGEHALTVSHPDFVPATVPVQVPETSLRDAERRLEVGPVELYGAVTLRGQVFGPEGPTQAELELDGEWWGSTDAAGQFVISQLEARPHVLLVSAAGLVGIAHSQRSEPGEEQLELTLSPGGQITVLPDGADAATVSTTWWYGLSRTYLQAEVSNGQAVFTNLFPGTYQVGGHLGGRIETIQLLPGEHRLVDLSAPTQLTRLTGTVRDPLGLAGGDPVYVFVAGEGFEAYREADSNGVFTFEELPEGPYEIFARCFDRAVHRGMVLVAPGTHYELELSPTGKLRGQVLDAAGQAVAGARVEVGMVGFGGLREATSDPQGNFELVDIYPYGHYHLRASSPLGSLQTELQVPSQNLVLVLR